MTELIAVLAAVGLVIAVDLLVTRWRKRIRLQEKEGTE